MNHFEILVCAAVLYVAALWLFLKITPGATMLHLFGLGHERLTYKHQGRRFRLTDVHGTVVDTDRVSQKRPQPACWSQRAKIPAWAIPSCRIYRVQNIDDLDSNDRSGQR